MDVLIFSEMVAMRVTIKDRLHMGMRFQDFEKTVHIQQVAIPIT